MQGLYVVAVGNVIRITGEEHDGDFPVLRAHRSRQCHAVHARHFDVQQQKVEGFVLFVLDEERFRRGERFDARGVPRLFRPGLRQQAGVLQSLRLVVANGHSQIHGILCPLSSFFIIITVSWRWVNRSKVKMLAFA